MRNVKISAAFAALVVATVILGLGADLFAKDSGVVPKCGFYDVRSYGATGDGVTNDAPAIQQAIDACNAVGGGTVVVPSGIYLIGTIYLKSDVDFYISEGATLLGSPNKEDYNAPDAYPQNSVWPNESNFGAHLILCVEQKNVTVRGPGRVDGNSLKFIVDENGVPYPGQDKIPWRPSQMLCFVESENVRVQDLELTNSTYWTLFLHGCRRVFIRGVQIQNSRSPHTHNGDGIDVDCCEYVSISDCQIDSADDCITLRASGEKLRTPRPCRYVTITNCVLSTPCNCFRFGVGNGEVRDVVVDNIVIESARTAFNFVSSWSENGRGVDIRNIRIGNAAIDCEILLHMYYNFATETEIKNIFIDGVSGRLRQVAEIEPERRDERAVWLNAPTTEIVQMVGKPGLPLKNARIANVDLDVYEGAVWTANDVEGLELDNVELRTPEGTAPVRFDFTNVKSKERK